MKEELIRVLNNKLDDINSDIDSLVELNDKISNEEGNLSFVERILEVFGEDKEENINNLVKINKDDFNQSLDVLDSDVKEAFDSDSCNYDGLVYLINGINSGVSLSLTDEQKNAILYLIHKLDEKKEEYNALIDGYKLIKERYAINDVDELKNKKEKYIKVLDDLANQKYVGDVDLLTEAISFSELTDDKTIEILKYLLEYNADIYDSGYVEDEHSNEEIDDEEDNHNTLDAEEEKHADVLSFDNNENNEPFNFSSINNKEEEKENDFTEFHFNDVEKDDIIQFSPSFYNDNVENEEKNDNDDFSHDFTFENNDVSKGDENEVYTPLVEVPSEYDYNEVDSETKEEHDELENENNDVASESEIPEIDTNNEEIEEHVEEKKVEENEEDKEETFDKVSTGDLQMLLTKYNIQEDNAYINELVVGDMGSYEDILETLNNHNLIDTFRENNKLLIETLLYSDSEVIENVLKIVKDDLSVDDEDYVITSKIVVNTIPSVFINQSGNYENFIENVRTFKELELNLINLFDFSKEIFIASHDRITDNLEIVEKYDIKITYQNAKYLLLLPDIADRIDYYVESVYEDKVKNEKFDGIEYIELYPAKLNVVTDETIKRLRYCSENGQKVFGNKPKSLVGEITNLKVNSLDITSEYNNKFFNNEFSTFTGEEVREYIKLIHNSSNVGNYDDELDFLDKYRHGMRYVINDINISYNKVVRNYSILRSYGIDSKKALEFAVCYNLVITKDEYEKLKNVLDELGGNK